MKSDLFPIERQNDIKLALNEVERIALYCGLEPENALTLVLLAEETVGLISGILNKARGELWVENQGQAFELHFRAKALIGYAEQDELIAVSTRKTNEATKGILGKISGMFESYVMAGEERVDTLYNMPYGMMQGLGGDSLSWSLSSYVDKLPATEKKDEWDGLEKSILISLADDILISVKSRNAEMIVKKKF